MTITATFYLRQIQMQNARLRRIWSTRNTYQGRCEIRQAIEEIRESEQLFNLNHR